MRNHFMRTIDHGIQFIGTASDTTAGGNFSIDISSIPIQPNDVCILVVLMRDPDTSPGITGFTKKVTRIEFANQTEVWESTLDGTETTVASTTGGDYQEVAAMVSIYRGVTTVGASWSEGEAKNDGEPPNAGPSGLVDNNVALCIAVGSISNRVWEFPDTPSGYTDGGSVNYVASNFGQIEVAHLQITSQEDPPAFGGDTEVTFGYIVSMTVTLQER